MYNSKYISFISESTKTDNPLGARISKKGCSVRDDKFPRHTRMNNNVNAHTMQNIVCNKSNIYDLTCIFLIIYMSSYQGCQHTYRLINVKNVKVDT
jgi:hypothetical protein